MGYRMVAHFLSALLLGFAVEGDIARFAQLQQLLQNSRRNIDAILLSPLEFSQLDLSRNKDLLAIFCFGRVFDRGK